jgi:hypothetical protein
MVRLLKKYSYQWLLTSAINLALYTDDDFIIQTLADVFIHPYRDSNASINAMYVLEEYDPYYSRENQYLLLTKENYLQEYERVKYAALDNARRINFLQMYDMLKFYNKSSVDLLSPNVCDIKARFEERAPLEKDIKAVFTQIDAMIAGLSGIPLIQHCLSERNKLLGQLMIYSSNATVQKVHDSMTALASVDYDKPTLLFSGGTFFLTANAQNRLIDQEKISCQSEDVLERKLLHSTLKRHLR